MYQYKGINDTIAAIATPLGQGGVGIVRMSGDQAERLASQVFRSAQKLELQQFESHKMYYGWVYKSHMDTEYIIDESLLVVMRAPKSYTRQDVVEIHCHGGMAAVKAVLERLLELGARLAEPGEFTKRAFLSGRIDLAQAEAVMDIIHSKTERYLRVSNNQLKGELSEVLQKLRQELMDVYVKLEAVLNFPEDDMDEQQRFVIHAQVENVQKSLSTLIESGQTGQLLREGMRVVLCGRPNAGKSSLMNLILKTHRAIVSAVEGTTRDVIEEMAQINGIPFQLVDTAGLLEPRDDIEHQAIERTHRYKESADLVLFLLDVSRPLSQEDEDILISLKGRPKIVVLNKIDLTSVLDEKHLASLVDSKNWVRMSVLSKAGYAELEKKMLVCMESEVSSDQSAAALVSNARHIDALKTSHQLVAEFMALLPQQTPLECLVDNIKRAVNGLDRITGRNIDIDLIDQIFSQFCIGK